MRLDVKPKESVRHPSHIAAAYAMADTQGRAELGTDQRRERERKWVHESIHAQD